MQPKRPYGPPVAAMGLDPDAAAYAAASGASGAYLAAVNSFIAAEKAAGVWALTDDYWGFWAPDATQALTSLKQRRLAVAVNSPTFKANRDYTFNGTTSYIDTGFIPSTHAVAMTASSIRIAGYERTNINGNTFFAGVSDSSNRLFRIRPRNSTSALIDANTGSAAVPTYTLPAANSQGFTAGSRNGGTAADCAGYKNGVAMTRAVDPTAFGATLPSLALFVGGYNLSGSLTSPRASVAGFFCVGAALSGAQEAAQYTNVQAWATAVGAQV